MRFLCALILMVPLIARPATTNQLTKWGITWQFSAPVEYGAFANGDYWVVAPVTVTSMSPAWDGANHGWEVNPTFQVPQGFRVDTRYSEVLRPALPFTISSAASLVKVIGTSVPVDKSFVQTAAVLTVLSSAPPDGTGAGYFRPPYVGTSKPLYAVASLRTDLLPAYAPTADMPTLASVLADFSKCLRMDHHPSQSRPYRPIDSLVGYQPGNTRKINEAMLRLMVNDPLPDKQAALVMFTQAAIDRLHAVMLGYRRADDGHNPNHRVMAAWAATILDLPEAQDYLSSATGFHEDQYLYEGIPGPLWGESRSELTYWQYLMDLGSSQSAKDPYNFIDGGDMFGGSSAYQNIVSQSLKGQALTFSLWTNLIECVPASRLATLEGYARRWVTNGGWTLPDPAAPYDGITGNYGITYGPNGSGSYIAGSGRFPTEHGITADEGQYRSPFVASMWDAYYTPESPPPPPVDVAPVITSGPLPLGQVGVSYSYALESSGDPAPSFAVTSGALPTGLLLSSAGVVDGVPTVAGTFTGTITVSNGVAPDGSQAFSVRISPPSPVILAVGVVPFATSATVSWTTSTPAVPTMEWGLTLNYGNTVVGALGTSHSFTITGLDSDTSYAYRLHSVDVDENAALPVTGLFTTGAAPPAGAVNIRVESLHAGQVTP